MATVASNNIVVQRQTPLLYPLDATGSNDVNQGDLVYFDTTAHLIKSLDSDAHAAAQFAGVAGQTSYSNVYGTKVYLPQLEVHVGCIATFNTTAAETYQHGDPVYYNTDAQTIQKTTGSNKLGYVVLRKNQAAVTGGAGVTIDVLVIPLFPSTGVA